MKNAIKFNSELNNLLFDPDLMNEFEAELDDLDAFMFGMSIHTTNLFSKLTLDDLEIPKQKGGRK